MAVTWVACVARTGEVICELPDLIVTQTSDTLMGYATAQAVLPVTMAERLSTTMVPALEADPDNPGFFLPDSDIMIPDPDNPGFYVIVNPTLVYPDPANPGFFLVADVPEHVITTVPSVDVAALSNAGAVTIVQLEDHYPVWGGITTRTPRPGKDSMQFALATIPAYFRRRYVGDVTFNDTDQCEIASTLVETYAADSLALEFQYTASATTRDRTYEDIEDKSLYDALTELANVQGGPEWGVTWRSDVIDGKQYYIPVFYAADRIGADPLTGLKPSMTFDLPGSVLEFEYDNDYSESGGANRVIATSTASGDTRPQSTPAEIDDGRPTMEFRFTPSTSITNIDTLNEHAEAVLARMAGGTRSLALTLAADASTVPGGSVYGLGDRVAFDLRALTLPGGLKGTARVVGFQRSHGGVEKVTPVLTDLTFD